MIQCELRLIGREGEGSGEGRGESWRGERGRRRGERGRKEGGGERRGEERVGGRGREEEVREREKREGRGEERRGEDDHFCALTYSWMEGYSGDKVHVLKTTEAFLSRDVPQSVNNRRE